MGMLSQNIQEQIVENLGIRVTVARIIRTLEAQERYNADVEPVIKLV